MSEVVNVEYFRSIRLRLENLLTSKEETAISLIDSLADLIKASETCFEIKTLLVEILKDQLKSLLSSADFQERFLHSKNVYLQFNSMKLLINYAKNFDEGPEDYHFSSLLLNYEEFGWLYFDAFERLFHSANPDDSSYIEFLMLSWRKVCGGNIVRNSNFTDFNRLFYTWHKSLSNDKRNLFFEECLKFWSNLYSSIFVKFFQQQNFDYCLYVESFKVINHLLTHCLEGSVFKENVNRINFANFGNTCKMLLNIIDFKHLDNKRHWFGGIDSDTIKQNRDTSTDLTLERLIILLDLKSLAILALNSGEIKNTNSLDSVDYSKQFDASYVIDLFIHQDDHLCELLLSNLLLEKSCLWNCHELMFQFLQAVDWNYEISLDFIISPETLFLTYFVKYLKKCLANIEELLSSLDNFQFMNSKIKKVFIVDDDEDNLAKVQTAKFKNLKVSELIGNVETTRNIIINPLLKCRRFITSYEENKSTNRKLRKMETKERFKQYLQSLTGKLEKLNSKQLIRFNPKFLLKQLHSVISKL